ncbi:MAG TPA: MerR family transcriptional regulator [Terriglobales bacterium]|nr:MerR family transcriptional regulator [Terriglobales bacterium]
MKLRISEFAQLAGVSAKALRYYDEIGLLSPAAVDARSGYRYYDTRQLVRLNLIVAFKDMGLALDEIRPLLSGSACAQRSALEALRGEIRTSIQKAGQKLRLLEAALAGDYEFGAVTVQTKRRPPVRIASVRATVDAYEHVADMEKELLANVPEDCVGKLRGVLWHRCADSGVLEGEPFIELTTRLSRRSVFDQRELPPATLACAYAGNTEEEAEHAYDAIRQWMRVQNVQLAGPKRELYWGELLEIQFPVA